MNILFVASELAPFAKTGGLADVLAALPAYLSRAGHDVRVVLPLYDTVDTSKATFQAIMDLELSLGSHRYQLKIFQVGSGPAVYFVHCPALYARGRLYTSDPDEHRRILLHVVRQLEKLLIEREQQTGSDRRQPARADERQQ